MHNTPKILETSIYFFTYPVFLIISIKIELAIGISFILSIMMTARACNTFSSIKSQLKVDLNSLKN